MSSAKLDKVIARQRDKIAEGQYYEAHQTLLVLNARYLKATPPAYAASIELLHSGALLLLQSSTAPTAPSASPAAPSSSTASAAASGADLACLLLATYRAAATPVAPESKARLLQLLRAFPPAEPTRRRFATDAVDWSKRPAAPHGDPELHQVYGTLLVEDVRAGRRGGGAAEDDAGRELAARAVEAERHLLLGTREGAGLLAEVLGSWAAAGAGWAAMAGRGVLGYLVLGNLRGAGQFYGAMEARAAGAGVGVEEVGGLAVAPGEAGLNFLGMLLRACEKGQVELWRLLKGHYAAVVEAEGWEGAVEAVGGVWFGVVKRREANPLMDMMAGMFGGGGGGRAPALDMD